MPHRFKPLDGGQRLVAYATFRPKGAGLGALGCALGSAMAEIVECEPEGYSLERITLARDNPNKRTGNRWHLAVYWFQTSA